MSDKINLIPPTARLRLDGNALASNWRKLDKMSGMASAGAAVKANAYGLGVTDVVRILLDIGCKDFYVANWNEAEEISDIVAGKANVSVLNGVRQEDMQFATKSHAKPVLNSLEQVRRWSETSKPCDVMINSGMNRLGINPEDLDGLNANSLSIDIVMSHLASADEDVVQNEQQLSEFTAVLQHLKGERISMANSAAIALGSAYHFDCTRPGLSLYGGKPRVELEDCINQVAFPQAQILQIRELHAGDKVGYNAKYTAVHDHKIAILAMGYADGYLRGFSNNGQFRINQQTLPVIGRVSMDLIAIDVSNAPQLVDGDWVDCEYDLPNASSQSGLSQYELLTGLGHRLSRKWHLTD